MKISPAGLSLIKNFESCVLKPYKDQGGKWTIGIGHLINEQLAEKYKAGITQAQADLWFNEDVRQVVDFLNIVLDKAPLKQNQFDSLCSFVFNIGQNAFRNSTMLKLLLNKDYTGAADQFGKWIYVNRKISTGLINRREKEKALFLKD